MLIANYKIILCFFIGNVFATEPNKNQNTNSDLASLLNNNSAQPNSNNSSKSNSNNKAKSKSNQNRNFTATTPQAANQSSSNQRYQQKIQPSTTLSKQLKAPNKNQSTNINNSKSKSENKNQKTMQNLVDEIKINNRMFTKKFEKIESNLGKILQKNKDDEFKEKNKDKYEDEILNWFVSRHWLRKMKRSFNLFSKTLYHYACETCLSYFTLLEASQRDKSILRVLKYQKQDAVNAVVAFKAALDISYDRGFYKKYINLVRHKTNNVKTNNNKFAED